MRRQLPMLYSAAVLTGVNLLLRAAGTTFHVYISRKIGAAGVGLLQLVMSVNGLALVAGVAGIRTAAMYLTADELGKQDRSIIPSILSGCFEYSLLCSSLIAVSLYFTAPWIAQKWIGTRECIPAIRIFAAFLPATCLCAVLTGYFTAEKRIILLAAVEIAEQTAVIFITVMLLELWAGHDPERACTCIISGAGLGTLFTLCSLFILRTREHAVPASATPVGKRILSAAAPLAVADMLKSGISALENLMVPVRLSLNAAVSNPLAAFGTLSGMVFPIIMFPACILYGLNELLIPELARCKSARNTPRIHYLIRKTVNSTLLYGTLCSGLILLLADELSTGLYKTQEAGLYLKQYAPLTVMLYCDSVVDAMTKGLGQQKTCVKYNIITSSMDVIILYFLLPQFGMAGYFVSFLITHLINFILSLRHLIQVSGAHIMSFRTTLTLISWIFAVMVSLMFPGTISRAAAFCMIHGCSLILLGVIRTNDLNWAKKLVFNSIRTAESRL